MAWGKGDVAESAGAREGAAQRKARAAQLDLGVADLIENLHGERAADRDLTDFDLIAFDIERRIPCHHVRAFSVDFDLDRRVATFHKGVVVAQKIFGGVGLRGKQEEGSDQWQAAGEKGFKRLGSSEHGFGD